MLSSPLPLPDDIRGRVIAPGDPGYDAARTVFPGNVDRRPRLIVRVADDADVARTIALAREHDLELAVRSGGHSGAGHGVTEGGVVIDLSAMRALEIDPVSKTAWAETGLTAGAYTSAAAEHGLATPFGDAGGVGLGGITAAGGIGFLVRKHGLTVDNVLAADVVTADGALLRADAERNPDLFWAVRGGGGNVGVVTRLRLRLHDLPQIVGGMLFLPATPETIAGFVAEAEAAPEALSGIATVMAAPPMPFLPAEHHGRLVLMAQLAYAGPEEEGQAALGRFRALADPLADLTRPMAYTDLFFPEPEDFHPVAVMRTLFVGAVDRRAAGAIVERVEASTAPMAAVQLRVLGGAAARVPAAATAFAHRDSRVLVNVTAVYAQPDQRAEQEAWVQAVAGELHDGDAGAYAGFLSDEGEAGARAAYPGATWDRLAAIKARYDPGNVFRLNANVPPASEERVAAA